MTFLGRKLHGNFQGDLVTDQLDFSQLPRRLPGRRVKHRMKRNWIKMYSKEGSVLRVETLIASPSPTAAPWRLRSSYVRSLTRASTPTLPEDVRKTQRRYGERFHPPPLLQRICPRGC
jgi:hypothetical protein